MFNGMYHGVLIIAEVKPWSPRGEPLTKHTWEEQLALADKVGHIISIHTHPLWRGSFKLLTKARKFTSKPILAKGFHGTDDEVYRALDAGADYVLIVGRETKVPLKKCFVEPLTLAELATIPSECWAVWNSRDLSSLRDLPGIPQFLLDRWKQMDGDSDRKRESFKEARTVHSGLLCQASNLRTIADIKPGANAVLVGSHLESFATSLGISS